jgi:hypothetical protein
MADHGGFGTVLTILIGTVPTNVAQIRDVDWPNFKKFVAESTGHDAADGYYTAAATGKRRIEPFNVTLSWDADDTTHGAIITAFDSDDAVSFSITDPASNETFGFYAHVEGIQRMTRQEGIIEATVLLHPTGPAA